jgi:hypothetical protein
VRAVNSDSPVSLRGVYYRVVSAGNAPKTEAAYRTIGRRLGILRRRGQVDYADITDGTRWISTPTTFTSMYDALEQAQRDYRRNLWQDQAVNVNIFSEKDAISGVIGPATSRFQVPLGVLRGYASESFCWSVARDLYWSDKDCVLYSLGDHDPSGVDSWRDFTRKVQAMYRDVFDGQYDITTERLAVTPEQIVDLNLLTRPTKTTDARSRGFSGESVEVDAIPAAELRRIVAEAIEQYIEPEALATTRAIEAQEKEQLLDLTLP